MKKVIDELHKIGIIPVVSIEDAVHARALGKALIEGGLPCVEVILNSKAAEDTIRILVKEFPEMVVGAGTILTTEQVDVAISLGVKFLISPGLNPKIVKYCTNKKIPIIPGCSSPTDIEQAIELGLKVVNFFPAQAGGGLPIIQAISAPYPDIKFIPTGGINGDSLNTYLDCRKVVACAGSWIVKADLIEAGNFEAITLLAKEAVRKMLGFELRHIGINAKDEDDAKTTAKSFADMFGLEQRQMAASIFVGTAFEVMKGPYHGTHGHIAVRTNFIDRAVYQMERMGYVFNMDTMKFDPNGSLATIYLLNEINGFAIHLVQRKPNEQLECKML